MDSREGPRAEEKKPEIVTTINPESLSLTVTVNLKHLIEENEAYKLVIVDSVDKVIPDDWNYLMAKNEIFAFPEPEDLFATPKSINSDDSTITDSDVSVSDVSTPSSVISNETLVVTSPESKAITNQDWTLYAHVKNKITEIMIDNLFGAQGFNPADEEQLSQLKKCIKTYNFQKKLTFELREVEERIMQTIEQHAVVLDQLVKNVDPTLNVNILNAPALIRLKKRDAIYELIKNSLDVDADECVITIEILLDKNKLKCTFGDNSPKGGFPTEFLNRGEKIPTEDAETEVNAKTIFANSFTSKKSKRMSLGGRGLGLKTLALKDSENVDVTLGNKTNIILGKKSGLVRLISSLSKKPVEFKNEDKEVSNENCDDKDEEYMLRPFSLKNSRLKNSNSYHGAGPGPNDTEATLEEEPTPKSESQNTSALDNNETEPVTSCGAGPGTADSDSVETQHNSFTLRM